mgnify:CR=1 FL=1
MDTGQVEDIAPFAVLPKDAWDVKGIDLSIPYNDEKTAEARTELERFLKELDTRPDAPKDGDIIRVIAYHNLAMAKKMLEKK